MSYRDFTNLTTETAISGIEAERPLEFDQTATVFRQDYMVERTSYSAPGFGVTCPAYPTAYFIGDSGFEDRGDSIWAFRRQWATVPAGYSEYQSFAYTYPAYTASTTGTPVTISGISISGSDLILTASTSGITASDLIYFYVQYSYTSGPVTYSGSYSEYTRAKTVGVTNLSVANRSPFNRSVTYTISNNSLVVKNIIGRTSPITLIVPSRVIVEFLYTLAPDNDLPISQVFSPLNVSGEKTNELSLSTTPKASDYSAMVADGAELVAECTLERWKGNIYRRTTRFVPAQ